MCSTSRTRRGGATCLTQRTRILFPAHPLFLVRSRATNPITPMRVRGGGFLAKRVAMSPAEREALLGLHRELCAVVRAADQSFGRMYVADIDSRAAAGDATRYRSALSHVRAALEALENALAGGPRDLTRELPATVECARQVC